MTDTKGPFYAVVNDLIGGYDVSIFNKPVSQHDTRLSGGEWTIGSFISEGWAKRIAKALNDPDVELRMTRAEKRTARFFLILGFVLGVVEGIVVGKLLWG